MHTFRPRLVKVSHVVVLSLLLLGSLPLLVSARVTQVLGAGTTPVPALVSQQLASKSEAALHAQARESLGRSSLMFIENVGQFDAGARFQVRGGDRAIWLAEDGLWVTVMEPITPTVRSLRDAKERDAEPHPDRGRDLEREDKPRRGVNLKLSFPGSNPHARLESFDQVDTRVSYFSGNDPDKWQSGVPVWGGVRYVDLYPGVDLEITGEDGYWTWRLVCQNQEDCQSASGRARLRVDGADTLSLETPRGKGRHVRLATAVGDFSLPLLQVVNADGAFIGSTADQPEVRESEVVAPFDSPTPATKGLRRELSPSALSALEESGNPPEDNSSHLLYSTILGGSAFDWGGAIAVDETGNAYVTGMTESSDFPTTPGAFDTICGTDGTCGFWHRDTFVVKLSSDGTNLEYATFLGGDDNDYGYGIAVDDAGSAYVTGKTYSSDFPMENPLQSTLIGTMDVFLARLSADGRWDAIYAVLRL